MELTYLKRTPDKQRLKAFDRKRSLGGRTLCTTCDVINLNVTRYS